MNALPGNKIEVAGERRPAEHTRARIIVLALVSFLAGAALSAAWFYRGGSHPPAREASAAASPAAALPDAARAVLQQPDSPVDPAALDAVRRSVPNLDAVSLEEGTKVLREAALAQFKLAAEETQAQVKEARQRFLQAQGSQSEAGQRAAREQLRNIQEAGADKLRQIAFNSRAQIAALQQLKKTAP